MNRVMDKENSFRYSKSLYDESFKKEKENGEKWIENKAHSEKN